MKTIDRLIQRFRYTEALSLIKKIEKKEQRPLKILDIGGAGFQTGSKSLSEVLKERGHEVLVGDISGEADTYIDLNKEIPFQDKSFDIVICLAVLEHLQNWQKALQEMKRVGRYVIFTTPSPAAKPVLEFLASRGIIDQDQIADHKHYLTKEEIEDYGYKHRYFEAGFNQLGYYGDIKYTEDHFLYIFLICFISVLVLFHSRYPVDDLLRHLKSHTFGYDYSKVYIHMNYLPSFNPWIGFDVLAGVIHSVFGFYSYIVMQIICTALVTTGLFLLTKDVEENTRIFMILLLFLLLQGRWMLARPGEFFTGVLLILWAVDVKIDRLIKFAIGLALSPFYWFFFIYLVPLVMKDSIYIFSIIGGVAAWTYGTHGEYIKAIINILSSVDDMRKLNVTENMSMLQNLLFYFPFFLPVFMGIRKDKKSFIAMIWFMLSNQLRYLENVLTMSAAYLRYLKVKVPGYVLLCMLPVVIFFPSRSVSYKYDLSFMEGKKVFCMSMMYAYDILYRVKEVKIAPSMSINWNDNIVKEIYMKGQKGEVDCSDIKRLNVDYVVDRGEFKSTPTCLKFDRVAGPYRVWIIKKEDNIEGTDTR